MLNTNYVILHYDIQLKIKNTNTYFKYQNDDIYSSDLNV